MTSRPDSPWPKVSGSRAAAISCVTVVLRLPPRELSPNARVRWAARAAAVKRYRESARLVALVALARKKPLWTKARVWCRFYFASPHRRDRDNLLASMKPAFDGLADAGVVADDCGMIHQAVEVAIDRSRPRVEIDVRGAAGGVETGKDSP